MNVWDLLIVVARVVIVFGIVMTLMPVMTWVERKGAAYIQDRRGPNRASILGIRLGGLIHVAADGLKLLTKETVSAATNLRFLPLIAPIVAFTAAMAAAAVIPFTPAVEVIGKLVSLQVADLRSGLIFAIALPMFGTYALLMAGWAGGSTYAMMGALRATAQFVSAGLAMGLAATAVFLTAGTLTLSGITVDQTELVWRWNVVRQPLAFLIYMTALFAETSRLPFDLPEGESEIVAGYHVEYSGMRFAMFYMAEYAHIVVGSAVAAAIFLGGWQCPFVSMEVIDRHATAIVAAVWPMSGMLLAVIGGWLMGRRRSYRFRDLRDYEGKFVGSVVALVGIALMVTYLPLGEEVLAFSWIPSVVVAGSGLAMMLAKTLMLACFFIWVRWTLPRFRYDQLMRLGWKVLLPLGIFNIVVTAAVLVYFS